MKNKFCKLTVSTVILFSSVIPVMNVSANDLSGEQNKDDLSLVKNGYLVNWDNKILIEMLSEGDLYNKVFNDIKGNVHEDSIIFLASNNIINGYSDGTFKPDNYLTRSDIIKMSSRVLEVPIKSEIDNIKLARELGTENDLELYSYVPALNDIFGVGNYKKVISRGDFSIYMVKILDKLIAERIGTNTFNSGKYLDALEFKGETNDDNYNDSVRILEYFGLTNAESDFKSNNNLTRGQLASFLTRLYAIDYEGIAGKLNDLSKDDLKGIIGINFEDLYLHLNKVTEGNSYSNGSYVNYSVTSKGLENKKIFITFNENLLNSNKNIDNVFVEGSGVFLAHITSIEGTESEFEGIHDNVTPKELTLNIEEGKGTDSYVAVVQLDKNGEGHFIIKGENSNVTPVIYYEKFEEDLGSMYEYFLGDGILNKKNETHSIGETITFY